MPGKRRAEAVRGGVLPQPPQVVILVKKIGTCNDAWQHRFPVLCLEHRLKSIEGGGPRRGFASWL